MVRSANLFEFAMSPSMARIGAAFQITPPAPANAGAIRFSHSIQPLETLRTVASRKVKGLALAMVVGCNEGTVSQKVAMGKVAQYLQEHGVSPTMAELTIPTLERAAEWSTPYVLFNIASWTGDAASILFAGNTIAASAGIKVATLLASRGSGLGAKAFQKRETYAALLNGKLLDGPDVDLAPGACVVRAPLVRWPVK